MDLFDLAAKISLDRTGYDKEVDGISKEAPSLASKIGGGLKTAAKVGVGAVTALGAGIAGGIVALNNLADATEEYRIAQGKLDTAYQSMGLSQKAANKAYRDFYNILGDTDTATEASQLLAQLVENEKDIGKWTNIAAGAYGTFGDSLPIEGLIESSNETAKVGKVTGVLADALNWVGINEDDFNAKLEECSDESERNNLIMETLSTTYDKASKTFKENNKTLIDQRNTQRKLDEATSHLAESFLSVKTSLVSDFLPSIVEMTDGLAGIISGDEGSLKTFNSGVQDFVDGLSEKIPAIVKTGMSMIASFGSAILDNTPMLIDAAFGMVKDLAKFIVDESPKIIETGGELLGSLADGLIESLPELIPMTYDVIASLAEDLTEPDNINTMVDTGIDLIFALADGLIDALPIYIEKAPIIVGNLIEAIAENAPKLIDSGWELIKKLGKGLWDNKGEIFDAGVDLIESLINGIGEMATDIIQIGADIIEDIKQGISDAWVGITEWFTGLWDGLFGGQSTTVDINARYAEIQGSNAVGLDYVPYDGYVSQLHRGERVLTAEEAKAYDKGGSGVTVIQNIYSQAKTAADLEEEAIYQAGKAVYFGV